MRPSWSLFLGLELRKHLIPSFKRALGDMFIFLLLYSILVHNQILCKHAEMPSLVWSVVHNSWTSEVLDGLEINDKGFLPYTFFYGGTIMSSIKLPFIHRDSFVPLVSHVRHKVAQVVFHALIDYFYHTSYLGDIWCVDIQLTARVFKRPLQKHVGKRWLTVRDDGSGHVGELENLIEMFYAIGEDVKFSGKAYKWDCFFRQYTNTIMTILLRSLGIATMRSIEMSIQIWLGIRSGCKAPSSHTVSALRRPRLSRDRMKLWIPFSMPSQMETNLIISQILWNPKWTAMVVACN